ncbi:YqjF family protein [Flavobacterium sp. SM2513]|uniref:YqjF family protein n=1 Tax=Flavobacterium sp. SM2513 TaxID=3424766 RepID=UPI003D7F7406
MRALKILNSIALLFLFGGAYGLPVTGLLQLIIAIVFLIFRPKNKSIYIYFTLVIIFFCLWNGNFTWLFSIPVFLILFLTYIIHTQNENSFMKAEWNDLLFINYEINPSFLKKYVPKGTELDLWNGKCYISLIGFMFENVKVLGMKIPFHVNFEEVNLRFYVKRFEDGNWKRGVVFIKEIVPKHAITFVANTLYNEQYQTLPMRHERTVSTTSRFFKYEWLKENFRNSISVETEKKLLPIEENSEAEFISEHYYGYTISPRQKTVEYEVKHPRWQQYKVIDYAITVDFELTYGKEFAFLQDLKADSCFVAKGSKISIESKRVF